MGVRPQASHLTTLSFCFLIVRVGEQQDLKRIESVNPLSPALGTEFSGSASCCFDEPGTRLGVGYGEKRCSILCLQGANPLVSFKILILWKLSKGEEILNLGNKF